MEKLVIITGTNASGKSGLAIRLARKYGSEIISADSRQVYKGLDLGSGKVTKEEQQLVPHHLLDVAEPNEFFSLLDFQSRAYEAIDEILFRKVRPILVGGTGLYINAVADGYQLQTGSIDQELRNRIEETTAEELIEIIREKKPEMLEKLDLKNKRRLQRAVEKILSGGGEELERKPRYETLVLGVTWPREVLYERIRERLDARLEQGMIQEVQTLREQGTSDDFLYKLGLEYRYILMYLTGKFPDYDAFYQKLFMEIRHLAKEQMTWFRKRQDIHWIDMEQDPESEASALIEKFWNT